MCRFSRNRNPSEDVNARTVTKVTTKKASADSRSTPAPISPSCATLRIDAMRGYIPGEGNLQEVLLYRSKYQPRGSRLGR
ncbi:hypothetical protein ACTXT7_017631 [Hymenolepis weldensis]